MASMNKKQLSNTTQQSIIRVAGKLKEIITIHDEKGNVLHKVVSPLMVEFYGRDLVQVIVGAALLAIPVAFTEEVWVLGGQLPNNNAIAIALLSLIFIATFVYYNFYRGRMKAHWVQFLKRTLSTYLISGLVVALLLTLIEKTAWQTDLVLTFKRITLVAFPASMSAAVADMIK